MKPNILWIGLDQLRYDTLGCNGNTVCQTPNMDRLARRGVSFNRAYCPSSLCTPARGSMWTGRYAFHHGLLTNCDMYHSPLKELPNPEMLLHPRLQEIGYRCGFIGKWHVGVEKGQMDYGFEGMNVPGYGNIRKDSGYLEYLEKNGLSYSISHPIYSNPDKAGVMAGHWEGPVESTPDAYLTERTLDLIDEYDASGDPFFLTCQYWDPHGPHFPSREYTGMHDRSKIEPWVNFKDDWTGKPEMVKRAHTDFYRALPKDWDSWREIVGLYYDMTCMVDAQIGRLLDRLEERGLADNTVIILTSDHGDMTGSHGAMNDKGLMYEEAHRVPLSVSFPDKFSQGTRSDELVYNMDLFPTLLDLLGMKDESLDGKSFLPVLEGKALEQSREAIYLEFHGIRFLYSQRAIVTRDGWKYVFTPGDKDECYNLNEDPGELRNLVETPEAQEKVMALRELLTQEAEKSRDPLCNAICKYFGQWFRNPTFQIQTSTI